MDESRALNYCLWLLGRSARTEAELRERMLGKEATPSTVDTVIARLREYRYVDDDAYAREFVRVRSRRHGRIRLRRDLLAKGVSEQLAESSLAALDDDSQARSALAALRSSAWRFVREGEDWRKGRARAWAFLVRRGFTPDIAAGALELFGQEAGWNA